VVVYLNQKFGGYVQTSLTLAESYYKVILSWVVELFCGVFLYLNYYKINRLVIFWLVGLTTSLFIIFSADPGSHTLYFDHVEKTDSPYLLMSDRYVLLLVFALMPFFIMKDLPTKIKSLSFSFICLIAIFTIGSRTMLYAFILCSGAIFFFIEFLSRRYGNIIMNSFILIFICSIGIGYAQQFQDVEGIGRMLAVFSNLEEDGSVQGRIIQYTVGWNDIINNPILGHYAGDVEAFGDGGNYIHGILSYWRQFGLIPFILICILVILTIRQFILSLIFNGINERDVFFLFLSILFSLSVIFSRTYTSSTIYICIGAAIMVVFSKHEGSKLKS